MNLIIKHLSIAFLLLFFTHASGQNLEKDICKCVTKSTKRINFKYTKAIHEIEVNLIQNGVMENSFHSKKEIVKLLATGAEVEKTRTIEHILFEQIGYKSLQYCTALHTYGNECHVAPDLLRMFGELNAAEIDVSNTRNYKKLQQDRAHILLKYWPTQPTKLWNMILIEFLYMYTKTPEGKHLDETFLNLEKAYKKTTN